MEYILHILVIAGIYIILTLSLNLIVGYTGLPALGHVAFSCIGAYTSSLLALNAGLSPWIGLFTGACVAALSGIVIGYPVVRFLGTPSSIAAPMRQMIYGLLLILLMIKRPQGIIGTYRFE